MDEPAIVVQDGAVFAPRLMRAAATATDDVVPSATWDPSGTVLITGGTGGLGALVARHLVAQHGVRQLMLISRRGLAAEGAEQLRDELTELGATVTIEACDVADRSGAVAGLCCDRCRCRAWSTLRA